MTLAHARAVRQRLGLGRLNHEERVSAARWACITGIGAHRLRRGSWHRVINETEPLYLVLAVGAKRVLVPRTGAVVRASKPMGWTLVHDDRPEAGIFGVDYGVCPNCVTRQPVMDHENEMTCKGCGFEFPLDRNVINRRATRPQL